MRIHYYLLLLLLLSAWLPASVSFGQYPHHHRNRGTVLGGLVGAVTGSAIGNHNDETAAGLAIGTAVGALAGAAIGDSMDQEAAWRRAGQQQHLRQQTARQLAQAVSVHDVIAMTRAGVNDGVIITHINANGVVSRPQPTDLITMSDSGVGEAVIRAMQTAPLATSPSPPVPVYPERVIVEEHHYVAPPYPRPVWHHHYYHCPHRYYHRPGVHWSFSFGD